MTRGRKLLMVIAALAVWATGAYPPWKLTLSAEGRPAVSGAVGNDWLINEKSLFGWSPVRTVGNGWGFSVDYGRLGIEWAIIATLYGAASRLLPAKADDAK
jgi:hypothetical protein